MERSREGGREETCYNFSLHQSAAAQSPSIRSRSFAASFGGLKIAPSQTTRTDSIVTATVTSGKAHITRLEGVRGRGVETDCEEERRRGEAS